MAKLTIMGDIIQLKSDLTEDEIRRAEAYQPDALKLLDNEGNEVFAIGIGDASYSKYGICFCSTDDEGKVFMSTDNPVRDHSDRDEERKLVVKHFAPILAKLEAVENNVRQTTDVLDTMEEHVNDSVTFA